MILNTTDRNSDTDSDPWLHTKRTKQRELGSPSTIQLHDGGIPRSPNRRGGKTSQDARRQRSQEDSSLVRGGGLWPSATGISVPSSSNSKKAGTLADHLGNERLRDFLDRKGEVQGDSPSLAALGRKSSTREIGRFENGDRGKDEKKSTKENQSPILGGSMRYTGRLLFPGRKSSSSSPSNDDMASPPPVIPPRYSVDENALHKKVSRRSSEPPPDSESECSDVSSASYLSSTGTSKKLTGLEVSSRYMNDATGRLRRETLDPSSRHSFDEGTRSGRFMLKGAIKRAGSLTGYGSAMSQWALSPGRSGSPPMSVENKEKTQSFSSLKPPSSPSRPKGVEKLLNLGLDLFKSKKSSSFTAPVGSGSAVAENVHRLRMLHNRLVQWQYANARANDTNARITNQAEINLASAMVGLTKLQHTVLQKKLHLDKERSEMKLYVILHSQIRMLERWGDLERQHTAAITKTSECLQSIVSRVPLIDGARIELKQTSSALRRASDIFTAAVKSNVVDLSLAAERTMPLLSELARVVTQEKLMMEECLDYLRTVSELEIRETSLMCNAVQTKQRMPQEQVTMC